MVQPLFNSGLPAALLHGDDDGSQPMDSAKVELATKGLRHSLRGLSDRRERSRGEAVPVIDLC